MKKGKRETLKSFFNIIKKSSDAEKKKSEKRKRKKQSKPKGVTAKKAGMITFWTLFSFMLLVTFVSIFDGGSDPSKKEEIIQKNKLLDHEGLEYAKSFVYEYFNWTTDKHGRDRLEKNLEPYFLNGIDSMGGIIYDKDWSSTLDKRDIELKDIQEVDKNRARYIFKIKLSMKSKTDKKDTKIDWEKLSFKDVLTEEEKVHVVNGYKVKVTDKYISVPVYYSDENDKFAIYDLPSFTFINEDRIDDYMENELSKLDTLSDGYAENNINAFMDTFFESYSKDSRDKLSYILEDKRHQYGLSGTMEYSSIKNTRIYVADDNNSRFIVNAEVILKEPTTKNEFMNKFLIVIKRKDQRYVVESLNDEKYVSEIIEKYIAEREETKDRSVEKEKQEENADYNYEGNPVERETEENNDENENSD